MIQLTRLNDEPIMVHAMQVESIEPGADTHVTLMSGKQLYVKETTEEVAELIRLWFASVFTGQVSKGAD
ncbi:MAG: flagellar FlbD family protein [Planctomycetota bacterium]|jgi:uncharacterized protein YlzI (FlbEa/FlbD family)|nr:flagellar FlbD family protein [Planctomycetota bacterium]